MNQNRLYDVHTASLTNWLVRHGYDIIRISTDRTGEVVYQFYYDKDLIRLVNEFRRTCKIYSLREANWLIRHGNDLIRAEPSDKSETRKLMMFIFMETDKLLSDIDEFNGRKGVVQGYNVEDTYVINSIKLANWLIRRGHNMIKAIDSSHDSTNRLKSFVFLNTDRLMKDMTEYTVTHNKQ